MTDERNWYYERLKDGKREIAPINDPDGKITGRHVFGLKAWFDENPEERKRLGWVKHITHKQKDVEYDHATQYLENSLKVVDDYTVEDDWKVMDMSEEQLRLAELRGDADWWDDGVSFSYGGIDA